jgi:hypothetical protein
LTIIPVVEQFSAELLDRYGPAYSAHSTLPLIIGAVDNVCPGAPSPKLSPPG